MAGTFETEVLILFNEFKLTQSRIVSVSLDSAISEDRKLLSGMKE